MAKRPPTTEDKLTEITSRKTLASSSSPAASDDEESCHPKYVPAHTTANCDCGMGTVGEELLCETARKGMRLFVSYEGGKQDSLSYEMVDPLLIAPSVQCYTAISHARAEGLGNTQSSSLPWCQIRRLQALVDELDWTSFCRVQQHHRTRFWIDTLCIPSDRQLRRLAGKSIYGIFSNAKNVLVVEPSLLVRTVLDDTNDNSESLDTIRHSSWLKRVWTLQEGAVASRLFFQLANGAVELDQLLRAAKKIGVGHNDLEPPQPFSSSASSRHTLDQIYNLTRDVRAVDLGQLRDAVRFKGPRCQLKLVLRSFIRLCYLALMPRFELFADSDEKKRASRMKRVLESDYGPSNEWVADSPLDAKKSLERLTQIWQA